MWSCKLRPIWGTGWATAMSSALSSAGVPMPERIRMAGEPIAPAARITSRRAETVRVVPPLTSSTPVARLPSSTTRAQSPAVTTARLGRLRAGVEIGDRGRVAPAVLLGELVEPEPLLVGVVEVAPPAHLELLGRLDEHLVERVGPLRVGHVQRPAGAVIGRVAQRLVVLRPAEIRQHLGVRPARAAERSPFVVVARMAADIDHAVDRARPAQHLAARDDDLAPAGIAPASPWRGAS